MRARQRLDCGDRDARRKPASTTPLSRDEACTADSACRPPCESGAALKLVTALQDASRSRGRSFERCRVWVNTRYLSKLSPTQQIQFSSVGCRWPMKASSMPIGGPRTAWSLSTSPPRIDSPWPNNTQTPVWTPPNGYERRSAKTTLGQHTP